MFATNPVLSIRVLTVSSATHLVCGGFHGLRGEIPNHVYRNGEIKILRACRAHCDQAEKSAILIDNRTTRIPWIYGSLPFETRLPGVWTHPNNQSLSLLIWLIAPVL